MADVKISELPEVVSLSPSDVLPSVASSATSKITIQNLAGTLPQVNSSISASYALTASFALNAGATTETFPYTGSAIISGSLTVTGSVRSSSGFTGSLFGTASWAQNAITASFVTLAQTASFVATASWARNALTASSADSFVVRNNITASNGLFTGTITAQTLVVQTVTSSVAFVTGSTKFGSSSANTHQFTGSVSITGSLSVVGPATINNLTGSLFGTSSWARNAVTASFVTLAQTASFVATASWARNAITASFVTNAQTASYVLNAVSASFVTNAATASFVTLAQTASYVETAQTASYVLQAISSSFATTASFVATASWAQNAITASYITGSVFSSTNPALSASYALTASFALNAGAAIAITVADEGTAQGTATFLNFIGAGVNTTVSANTASINISSAEGIGSVSLHTQPSPAVTWSFNHELNNDYPVLNVWDNSGFVIIPGGIKSIDENNIEIYFNIPQSGYASAVVGGSTASASFSVSSSYALTASYALNAASTDSFPYTGSANITGSLNVIGDNTTTGSLKLTGSIILSDSAGSALINTQNSNSIISGINTVAVIPTASYYGAFFDYVVKKGDNLRAGTVISVWSSTTWSYTDNSTTDIGNTSEVIFSIDLIGDNARLNVNVDTDTWTVKTLVRAI